jgi:ketosteroid isomerase-like protein
MRTTSAVAVAAVLASAAPGGAAQASQDLREQVRKTEVAFAKTMADRDHAAFTSFLAEETVFMGRAVLRGKAAVAAGWKRFYDGREAPFSWEPDRVEVLDSGTLGLTTGPVRDATGERIGTFNSVWRLEADGRWRIVFDVGCPPCEPTPSPTPPEATPRPPDL